MLNVTKELTALARKLGYTGKAPDTVAKAINAITSVAGGGGGSGDGGMIVHLNVPLDETEPPSTIETAGEIFEAITTGKSVYFEFPIENVTRYCPATDARINSSTNEYSITIETMGVPYEFSALESNSVMSMIFDN